MSAHAFKNQRGVVMVIAMIMLIAITLMVVTASNIAQTNLRIVGNMESREQARFAAIAAIEEALSSSRFADSPTSIFLNSCGVANRKCYDSNGDGIFDITVQVSTPTCVSVIPKKNVELDVFNFPDQATCHLPPGVYSMCAASVWEFEAVATDVVTGAEVTVRQGVSILTTLNKIDTACPV
ncbi:pilus assembly PilX family protein [Haliea sp. E17]|uniref:pilus assembly PilX family protein n=1 Tax=Haliea sp. E17 TaxID=3401576 RepID=UPI003AAFB232